MKRIQSLTGWRFLLVLVIAVSHLEFLGGDGQHNAYDLFFHNPGLAVSFFFMVSGFGLTYRAFATQRQLLTQPLWRWETLRLCVGHGVQRVRKVYGLYLLTCLLTVPVFVYMGISQQGQTLTGALLRNGIKLLIMPTLLQSATGITSLATLLNGVGWFLSCMFVLYIAYPLLERWNFHRAVSKAGCWLPLVLALGVVMRAGFVYIGSVTALDYLYYGSPYIRVFEFVAGMLVCDLFIQYRDRLQGKIGTGAEIAVTAAVLVCVFTGAILFQNAGWLANLVEQLLALCLIFVFAFEGGRLSAVFAGKTMVALGNASMYIFLIHYCVRIHISQWVCFLTKSEVWSDMICVAVIVAVTALWTALLAKKDSAKE